MCSVFKAEESIVTIASLPHASFSLELRNVVEAGGVHQSNGEGSSSVSYWFRYRDSCGVGSTTVRSGGRDEAE